VARVLVVEDDPNVLAAIVYALQQNAHSVDTAANSRDGLALAEQNRPDLILLDVMLPDGNGFALCEALRRRTSTPILMVTGVADEASILRGFECGADDYVTKPFSPRVLVARAQAVLNRAAPLSRAGQHVQFGALVLDFGTRQVTVDGREVRLSPIESDLLFYLALHRGRIIYAEELAREVWHYQCTDRQAQSVVKTAVSRLRAKIEAPGERAGLIQTVRGKGYTLAA
jgi:DNA-binding response OmpR family regulator